MGAAPCSLEFAHDKREVGVLPDDGTAGYTPRVGACIIKVAPDRAAIKILVKGDCRFTGEQCIEPADCLPDRLLTPFRRVAEPDRPANQFLWTGQRPANLLDLGERCRCPAKILARHSCSGDHHDNVCGVERVELQRIGTELVNGQVPHRKRVLIEHPCNRADVG